MKKAKKISNDEKTEMLMEYEKFQQSILPYFSFNIEVPFLIKLVAKTDDRIYDEIAIICEVDKKRVVEDLWMRGKELPNDFVKDTIKQWIIKEYLTIEIPVSLIEEKVETNV